MGITNHFLAGLKPHLQNETYIHYHYWTKNLSKQVLSPRGEPSIVVPLNRHGIKLTSDDLSLYLETKECISQPSYEKLFSVDGD